MLATERTNRLDKHYKNQQEHQPRFSSTSTPRRSGPILIVEQKTSNHLPNTRSQRVRFTSAGIVYFH